MPTPSKGTPWWLEGEELCSVCLQEYVYELRVHCDDCDSATCPNCIEWLRVETQTRVRRVCPGCRTEEGAAD